VTLFMLIRVKLQELLRVYIAVFVFYDMAKKMFYETVDSFVKDSLYHISHTFLFKESKSQICNVYGLMLFL
jgi:hypothetical protein